MSKNSNDNGSITNYSTGSCANCSESDGEELTEPTSGEKNLAKKKNFKFDDKIYDFTIYKINNMMEELWRTDLDNPEIFVLNNILEMYIDCEIDIRWCGGYPMPLAADGDDYFDFDIAERVMEDILH